ncbi:MAG TPA: phospholipase D-like domain-containing protein [Nannocystis sp.]
MHEGASLHAKCVVVDGEHTLIGSANFTDRAHTRNVEAGALTSHRRFAALLIDQLHGLINAGHFLPLSSARDA